MSITAFGHRQRARKEMQTVAEILADHLDSSWGPPEILLDLSLTMHRTDGAALTARRLWDGFCIHFTITPWQDRPFNAGVMVAGADINPDAVMHTMTTRLLPVLDGYRAVFTQSGKILTTVPVQPAEAPPARPARKSRAAAATEPGKASTPPPTNTPASTPATPAPAVRRTRAPRSPAPDTDKPAVRKATAKKSPAKKKAPATTTPPAN
ncbi:hypothetical protein ACN20G_33235 (plasmid) [Streptomyces sp. BI20]|uniref:hypothetical protein n=1 Tax=Streptomyces sp. BI20 TaxID=3403460 RepID=UPI003C73D89D